MRRSHTPPSNVLETKYLVTRNGPMGSTGQASVAASFFAKNQMKAPLPPSSQVFRREDSSSEERNPFSTSFRTILSKSPPPCPPYLLKKLEGTNEDSVNNNGGGRIKILLRVAYPTQSVNELPGFFSLDHRRRQITLYDPSGLKPGSEHRSAPKMFAFDGLFASSESQEAVCGPALSDVLRSVLDGNDGSVFCFGHAHLGKTRTMIGSDGRSKDLGVIPTALSWLYKALKDRKSKTGSRYSVRVSALEITKSEEVKDLLASYSTNSEEPGPGVYLSDNASHLSNLSELRSATPEKAGFYLDAALSHMSKNRTGCHFLFTVHLYQYTVDVNSNTTRLNQTPLHAGRSRLHLLDFGSCDRIGTHGAGISLSGLSNTILSIFNGQKHIPHRESKVTQVLKECLGSLACNATLIAHVSPEPSHYSETLHTVSVASRLHRMKRKRVSSSRLTNKRTSNCGSSSSDFTSTTNASSSEFSVDTVVYRGASDGSGTDCEHPPPPPLIMPQSHSVLYGVRSLRMGHSAPGSLEQIPRSRKTSKILTNGAISPRNTPRSHSSLLPAIPESRKMPLSGQVPSRRRTTNYGYMDDSKANMIHTWVNCTTTPVFKVLTQFKTCEESDEEKKLPPPPPPPRKIPPRIKEDSLAMPPPPPMNITEDHPLRILSHENLTVISSFGGSLADVHHEEENENQEEESKFLQAPEFSKVNEETDGVLLDKRFQELADLYRLHNSNNNNNNNNNSNIGKMEADRKNSKDLSPFCPEPKLETHTSPNRSEETTQPIPSEDVLNNNSNNSGDSGTGNDIEDPPPCLKKESRFSFRFLRFLKRKQSKSKSATTKPVETITPEETTSVAPSVLSLDTEWEYQNQGNQDIPSYGKLLERPSRTAADRKSSGYDSIGGESSSLDSNEEPVKKHILGLYSGIRDDYNLQTGETYDVPKSFYNH